ncbi:putative shikimate O-hydroxycinnamoyltransferase [Rosa chinensis]|uniref:Putative shikimate O-hydroxycinnamoyltransferase n=1 Tax=Rosa chinensis TaxID=74649 RepID=A0A2P6QJA9_ROSCH|nr:putative shikimate O-hydroxycinnamoyltransferase [Rosa chinensis]
MGLSNILFVGFFCCTGTDMFSVASTILGPALLGITSWFTLPLNDADFGWGRPSFMGRAGAPSEGKAYTIPSATNDDLSLYINLHSRHMNTFTKLVYDI